MSIFLLIINISKVINCSSFLYQSGSELDITVQEIILNAGKVKEFTNKRNFIIFFHNCVILGGTERGWLLGEGICKLQGSVS